MCNLKFFRLVFSMMLCLQYITDVHAQLQFNSLQEVLKFADKNAITIKSTEMQENLWELKVKESKTDLLPTLNKYAAFNDNITLQPSLIPAQVFDPSAPDGSFREVAFGTKYNYSIGVQVQWDILNFQKLFAVKTAKRDWELGKQNTAVSKMNTYNSLANTYYSIVLTKDAIKIYEENLNVAKTIYTNTKNNYQKGLISEAELNSTEIKFIQTKSTLNTAKNNLGQFYLQLQSQLNSIENITISDNIQTFELINNNIDTPHPEILLKEAEIQKQTQLLKQTKALRYPTLSLSYQNNRTWATNDLLNFDNAQELPNQVFSVSLNVPFLFDFKNKQKIKQSKLELDIKQQELQSFYVEKQKEDELLQLQLNQATLQAQELKEILNLQKKNDTHANNKYEKNLISLDQRLNQYDDLLMAQDNYLQSIGALAIAKYQLYIRKINYN